MRARKKKGPVEGTEPLLPDATHAVSLGRLQQRRGDLRQILFTAAHECKRFSIDFTSSFVRAARW